MVNRLTIPDILIYIYIFYIIWCIIKEVMKKVFRGDSLEQFNFWTLSDEGFRC